MYRPRSTPPGPVPSPVHDMLLACVAQRRDIPRLWGRLARLLPQAARFELFAFGVMGRTPDREERVRELVSPQVLFEASVQLWPEGRRRPPAAITFETNLLAYVDAQGQWTALTDGPDAR